MDSEFMNVIAEGLAATGVRVTRFEFDYMAARRTSDKRPGPDRAPKLMERMHEAIAACGGPTGLLIGGKSMGGRIASMLADEAGVAGLVCLGYPFHPPGKPDKLRTAHLSDLKTPTLIVQGTRDTLGNREEVRALTLPATVQLEWLEDGDHSFKPRKRSGRTHEQAMMEAVQAVAQFTARNGPAT